MKITFNDGQELQIQQVTEQTDGALLIKTISASEDQLKTLFSDQTTTKRMSVSEGMQIPLCMKTTQSSMQS